MCVCVIIQALALSYPSKPPLVFLHFCSCLFYPWDTKRWLPHEHASLCVFVCLFVCVCALKVILQSQPVCLLIKVFPHRETVMER